MDNLKCTRAKTNKMHKMQKCDGSYEAGDGNEKMNVGHSKPKKKENKKEE